MKLSRTLLGFLALPLALGALEISPAKALIVRPAKSAETPLQKAASAELQEHFQLITGVKVETTHNPNVPAGVYAFRIGAGAPTDATFKQEESHWKATATETVFYGDETNGASLFAVYDFLENALGVHWLDPYPDSISYTPSKTLNFAEGSNCWIPTLQRREIRNSYYKGTKQFVPAVMQPTEAEFKNDLNRNKLWLRRMRMAKPLQLRYGHAFVGWYQKYHAEHPEYFAMQKDGTREYRSTQLQYTKFCVSNPDVVKLVVDRWIASGKPQCINTCENDGSGYCLCPNCKALDAPLPDGSYDDHMTDRYLHFTNAVLREAQKYRPDVIATMYAYGEYRFPPRREKCLPNSIFGFVPSMLEQEAADTMYQKWHETGATKMFLRPNDHHVNIGFPLGFEECMFNAFQLGIKHGIIGTDYDSLLGLWDVTGIADYILAKAHTDPSKPFAHWENEYCGTFGPAADAMKDYFRYWRTNVWNKRILPKKADIVAAGRYGDFRRGMIALLAQIYTTEDFDATDAILAKALACPLNDQQKDRVSRFQLANKHSRLYYMAFVDKDSTKIQKAIELTKFRLENKNRLHLNWTTLYSLDNRNGDCAAAIAAATYSDYKDFKHTSFIWKFKLDPENVGLGQKWDQTPPAKFEKWSDIRIGTPWESQYAVPNIDPALKKTLETYDGYGWYAVTTRVKPEWKGSRIFLHFGAIDESGWCWFNGRKVGERIYTPTTDEWKFPVAFDVTDAINWNAAKQTIIIRVQDTGGQGGLWKPVALVTQDGTVQK